MSDTQRPQGNSRVERRSPRSRRTAIVVTIAVAAFLGLRQSELSDDLDVRFVPNPDRNVVIYTTSWCSYCARARSFLRSNGVAYREIDVEASEEGRLAYERLGVAGVPVFQVDDEVIRGLDLEKLTAALALHAPER